MRSKNYSQEQLFSIARYANADKSSSLVCFLYPKSIKGTAILLTKDEQTSSTLVYFPSLGRSRLIPKEDENNEAFGLGLSFAEIQNSSAKLQNRGEISREGHTYYKLSKEHGNQKTIYFIDKQSMIIKEMDIYENNKLIKKIVIDAFSLLHGKKFVTKWHINDYVKDKETSYSVNKKSITTSFNKRIFKRSAISHCKR